MQGPESPGLRGTRASHAGRLFRSDFPRSTISLLPRLPSVLPPTHGTGASCGANRQPGLVPSACSIAQSRGCPRHRHCPPLQDRRPKPFVTRSSGFLHTVRDFWSPLGRIQAPSTCLSLALPSWGSTSPASLAHLSAPTPPWVAAPAHSGGSRGAPHASSLGS